MRNDWICSLKKKGQKDSQKCFVCVFVFFSFFLPLSDYIHFVEHNFEWKTDKLVDWANFTKFINWLKILYTQHSGYFCNFFVCVLSPFQPDSHRSI